MFELEDTVREKNASSDILIIFILALTRSYFDYT